MLSIKQEGISDMMKFTIFCWISLASSFHKSITRPRTSAETFEFGPKLLLILGVEVKSNPQPAQITELFIVSENKRSLKSLQFAILLYLRMRKKSN